MKSNRGRKNVPFLHLWVMRAQGQLVGAIIITYICTLLSHKFCNSCVQHVGRRMGRAWNSAVCLSGLLWLLASSRLKCWLLGTTKWPLMIPIVISKSSADSPLVNSTCNPTAKEDMCCQSGSSHVETPGRSYSAGRRKGTKRRGWWGVHQAFQMQLFCIGDIYLQGKW